MKRGWTWASDHSTYLILVSPLNKYYPSRRTSRSEAHVFSVSLVAESEVRRVAPFYWPKHSNYRPPQREIRVSVTLPLRTPSSNPSADSRAPSVTAHANDHKLRDAVADSTRAPRDFARRVDCQWKTMCGHLRGSCVFWYKLLFILPLPPPPFGPVQHPPVEKMTLVQHHVVGRLPQ